MKNDSATAGGAYAADVAHVAPGAEPATTPGPAAEPATAGHQQPRPRRVARNPDGSFAPLVPEVPRDAVLLAIREALETDPSAVRRIVMGRLAAAEANCRELDSAVARLGALTPDHALRVRKIVNKQAAWSARVEALLRLLVEMPVSPADSVAALRRAEAKAAAELAAENQQ